MCVRSVLSWEVRPVVSGSSRRAQCVGPTSLLRTRVAGKGRGGPVDPLCSPQRKLQLTLVVSKDGTCTVPQTSVGGGYCEVPVDETVLSGVTRCQPLQSG